MMKLSDEPFRTHFLFVLVFSLCNKTHNYLLISTFVCLKVGDLRASSVFGSFTLTHSTRQSGREKSNLTGQEEWDARGLSLWKRMKAASEGSWLGRQKRAPWQQAMQAALPHTFAANRQEPEAEVSALDDDFQFLASKWPLATSLFELGTAAHRRHSILKHDGIQKLTLAFVGQLVHQ